MIDARRKIAVARARLYGRAPYLTRILFALRPIETPDLQHSMAVDQQWRLYYQPDSLAAWKIETVVAALAHECMHCLLKHHDATRFPRHNQHEADAWNLAQDAAINDDLKRAGFHTGNDWVYPDTLGRSCEQFRAEEYYYPFAKKHAARAAGAGVGAGKCGSCSAGELPSPNDKPGDGDGTATTTAEIIRRQVAADIQAHAKATKNRGSIPQSLILWADAILAPPVIPWQRVLATLVRHACSQAAGLDDFSYGRPSRRASAGQVGKHRVILPAMIRRQLNAAVVLDTSGSMSTASSRGGTLLENAYRETMGVVRAAGGSAVVLGCDSAIHATRRLTSAADLKHVAIGGGGTDMGEGLNAVAKLRPAPDVTVVITDNETPWPKHNPTRSKIVVAVVGNYQGPTPAWAKTVQCEEKTRT